MRLLPLILLPLFIAACNGLNSSMSSRTGQPGGTDVDQKPGNCKADFTQTCWSRTIDTITSCLKKGGTDVFSADGEFCTNSTNNQLIHFQSVTDVFTRPMDFLHSRQVAFKVYPDSVNECFSVSGNSDKFTIRLKQSGEKIDFKYDAKEMAFTCLDGQEVHISADKINGCQNTLGGEFAQQVPGFVFEPIVEKGVERGWQFRFRGAPDSPDVFKCHYPQ